MSWGWSTCSLGSKATDILDIGWHEEIQEPTGIRWVRSDSIGADIDRICSRLWSACMNTLQGRCTVWRSDHLQRLNKGVQIYSSRWLNKGVKSSQIFLQVKKENN